MNELPMPSDLKTAGLRVGAAPSVQAGLSQAAAPVAAPALEPPSVKLIVRLFLIPLLIAVAVIGIMLPISKLAGGSDNLDDAIARLKKPGGERTGEWLVGPGSKQRYMDAQAVTNAMKTKGRMTEAERIKLCGQLIEILDHYTKPEEGVVQHFLLLALGRVWQVDPEQASSPMNSPEAAASRQEAMSTLLKYADADQVPTRKAALLALAYWAGRDEVKQAIPVLIRHLKEDPDVDVRMAAATALGPLASPDDQNVIEALNRAMRDSDPRDVELVWDAAGSLAQLNRPEAKDTILKLLDRKELAELRVYDRETDPKNPTFRPLSEQEQQRILINSMLCAKNLHLPEVQDRLKQITASDPSERVRAAGQEILQQKGRPVVE